MENIHDSHINARMSTARRWAYAAIAAMSIGIIASCIALFLQVFDNKRTVVTSIGYSESFKLKMKIIECSIQFGLADDPDRSFYHLKDRRLIEELVESPLRNATLNTYPSRWIIEGVITFTWDDGSKSSITIGRNEMRTGGKYYKVNFDKLMILGSILQSIP